MCSLQKSIDQLLLNPPHGDNASRCAILVGIWRGNARIKPFLRQVGAERVSPPDPDQDRDRRPPWQGFWRAY